MLVWTLEISTCRKGFKKLLQQSLLSDAFSSLEIQSLLPTRHNEMGDKTEGKTNFTSCGRRGISAAVVFVYLCKWNHLKAVGTEV